MRGKAQRIKSEVLHLDYISPWRAPMESGRNEIELLINKNKILEEIASPKTPRNGVCQTEANEGRAGRDSPKKSARTCVKTVADCQREMQRTFNSHFYSRSEPLRNTGCLKRAREMEHVIFAKKSKPTQKPKLVSLGNEPSPEPVNRQSSQNHSFGASKKRFMLKKQFFTCNFLKSQIISHKGFISSLQGCLSQVEGSSNPQQTEQLTRTLKNFLSHYKQR